MSIKQTLDSAARCLKWLPILWKDREWDYSFLLRLLEFKLRNMQHFYESDNTHLLNSQKTGQDIKQVADALQRYRDYNYCDEWYGLLYAYHGKIQDQWIDLDNDLCEFAGFTFPHSDNEEKAIRIWEKLNQRKREMQQEDFELVFDLLKKNLQNWWD